MLDLIKELEAIMKERKVKANTAAMFIHCTARQVGRWIKGESIPSLLSREAIRRGINRMKRL